MKAELKRIIGRKVSALGCLDRLTDYSQEVLAAPFSKVMCGRCDPPDDTCEGCGGYEATLQLEYDIQTEVILFSEELVARVLESL